MASKIFFLILTLVFLGCQKPNQDYAHLIQQEKKIVASKEAAFERVTQYLAKQFPEEALLQINHVSFVHGSHKIVALIFYQTQTGEHNLVIEQELGENENVMGEKLSTCYGDDCTCKVRVMVDNNGNVEMGCNCSSCYMVTTEV
jgi:hypothetical protein